MSEMNSPVPWTAFEDGTVYDARDNAVAEIDWTEGGSPCVGWAPGAKEFMLKAVEHHDALVEMLCIAQGKMLFAAAEAGQLCEKINELLEKITGQPSTDPKAGELCEAGR